MIDTLSTLFSSEDLMPHGVCFLWRAELLWLHAVSDALIALSYYSIPFALVYFVYKRSDLVFRSVFLLFGIFILACGTTHVMGIWTLWTPDYWLGGLVKVVTAVASVGTALVLWHVMPDALALPSPAQLETANHSLAREIQERRQAQDAVNRLNVQLEDRVQARTAELQAANERLRVAVRDKQVLLQEVHHRVKNNLQVISSLLSIQAREAPPELMTYFRDTLDRIHAMGRVHEQLHQAETAGFDVGIYLENLCRDIAKVYGAGDVRCSVETVPVTLGFDVATPLVLIVNEIMSNIFKHAFPDGAKGEIRVSLRQQDGAAVLTVSDNGSGLPQDRRPENGGGMGLTLVEVLAMQIGARVQFSSRNGTSVILTLPLQGQPEDVSPGLLS